MRAWFWAAIVMIAHAVAQGGALWAQPAHERVSAPLVSPSAGASTYSALAARPAKPVSEIDPRIAAAAESLNGDPDLIFSFVRNHVDVTPQFGLTHGAAGALMERRGSAFDQAELFVEMLRASGRSAQYRLARVRLSGAQFEALWGLSSPDAARVFLAEAGVPATVSGASGTISGVEMLHVHVAVSDPGGLRLYDPSFKVYETHPGVDLAAAAGFSPSAFRTQYEQGSSVGVEAGVDYVQNVNTANIDGYLRARAGVLHAALRSPAHHAKSAEAVLGGRRILHERRAAQIEAGSSLSYAVLATEASWSGDLPNALRTAVTIDVAGVRETVYADAVYGDRLAVWTEQRPSGGRAGIVLGAWETGGRLPTDCFSAPGCAAAGRADVLAQGAVAPGAAADPQVVLTLDAPYAAQSGGYGDFSVTKRFFEGVLTDLIVAAGPRGAEGFARYELNAAAPGADPGGADEAQSRFVLERSRPDVVWRSWASQVGRFITFAGSVLDARGTHHASLGVVSVYCPLWSDHGGAGAGQCLSAPETAGDDWVIGFDVETRYSLVLEDGDAGFGGARPGSGGAGGLGAAAVLQHRDPALGRGSSAPGQRPGRSDL